MTHGLVKATDKLVYRHGGCGLTGMAISLLLSFKLLCVGLAFHAVHVNVSPRIAGPRYRGFCGLRGA